MKHTLDHGLSAPSQRIHCYSQSAGRKSWRNQKSACANFTVSAKVHTEAMKNLPVCLYTGVSADV